jgi:hypothetical protein
MASDRPERVRGSGSRQYLSIFIHEGDAEAVVKEKQKKALAEHAARHPEDAGRTVEDFGWIVNEFVQWPPPPIQSRH